jgi:diguanylate cyclase (GGDEF)-like protein/PAS domain S-box-containing protein
MARAAALLFVAGSAIGILITALPHAEGINGTAYLVIDAVGLLTAGLIWTLRKRLPPNAYHLFSAIGILMVAGSIYYSGNLSGGPLENELLFLWPILYAGYFFGRRGMALQLGIVGIVYAGLLLVMDTGQAGIARWGGTVGTLAAAAVFVRYLREQLDRDISLQQATIESTTDGILVVDANGRWTSFNLNFVDMWRLPAEIARSRDDDAGLEFALDQLEEPGAFIAKVRELYNTPDAESYDELRFKDGRVFERYSQPQRIEGRSVGRVWSFRDVTETKRAGERLQHLADHDPLTDLFNRRRFEEELEREVARSDRYETAAAVLLLDLDNFKGVNDTYGHIWGDEVLRAAARLLQSRLRSTDVLARLGGDEFAILLPESDKVRAVKLAEELLEVFREHTLDTDRGQVRITTSIGVVAFGSGDPGPEEPLAASDDAMYRAKREGRDRLAVYDAELDGVTRGPRPRDAEEPGTA